MVPANTSGPRQPRSMGARILHRLPERDLQPSRDRRRRHPRTLYGPTRRADALPRRIGRGRETQRQRREAGFEQVEVSRESGVDEES